MKTITKAVATIGFWYHANMLDVWESLCRHGVVSEKTMGDHKEKHAMKCFACDAKRKNYSSLDQYLIVLSRVWEEEES